MPWKKIPEAGKQRSLQAHLIVPCIPHPAQKDGSPRGQHPQQGTCVCPSEISALQANSHVTGINCTSPVSQSRAKMLLCNPKLVLLGKMFHQINCRRKGSVINYACLSSLSYVRSAWADKDEDILYSFKNGVPYEEINWVSKELAPAIYFQCIRCCHFRTV